MSAAESRKLIARRLVIHGRVQAVGFRFFVFEKAQSFGITGWVRNCSDGTVEILAEGSGGEFESFIAHCKLGPTFSRVEEIEEYPVEVAEYSEFTIRY